VSVRKRLSPSCLNRPLPSWPYCHRQRALKLSGAVPFIGAAVIVCQVSAMTTTSDLHSDRARARPTAPLGRHRARRHGRSLARSRRRESFGRGFLLLAVVLFVVVALVPAPLAAAPVSPATAPSPATVVPASGSVIIYNVAVVQVGYLQWTSLWYQLNNGSQTFTQAFNLFVIGLGNTTVRIGIWEGGSWYSNTTFAVTVGAQFYVSVPVAPNPSWTTVRIYMNGVNQWSGQIAVPLSLIPLTGYNIGGLDILVLGALSFMLVGIFCALLAAAGLMRRVLLAPSFNLLIWGHVIILACLGTVLLNFQTVNNVTAGWSPLLYPFLLAPMAFFAMLSVFNKADRVEVLQLLARADGKVGFRRWEILMGVRLRTGEKVIMRRTWGDFWARVWGHFIVIASADPLAPEPFYAEVSAASLNFPVPMRSSPAHWPVYDDRPRRRQIAGLMWSLSDKPVVVNWFHLTIHRVKTRPEWERADGTKVPAHSYLGLTWPHYVGGTVEDWDFAPAMFAAAPAVIAEWLTSVQLAGIYGKTKDDLYLTKSHKARLVIEEAETGLNALMAALGVRDRIPTIDEARTLIMGTKREAKPE